MAKVDFKSKISIKRSRASSSSTQDINDNFESDRGRIINSAAIRRLQQKTQVFPLEKNAAVRSRLTHSLEVQQVGRHIAKAIVSLLKNGDLGNQLTAVGLADYIQPFESMVEMACLMHDIGNPPFGHFGEDAICKWFTERLGAERSAQDCPYPCLHYAKGYEPLDDLKRRIRLDLSHFEGNAQAIRQVHTLLQLNLTYSQLASILKYTRPAYWPNKQDRPEPASHSYLMKKPGFYLSEEALIKDVRHELGMKEYSRYPVSYIMEAADDISYCIADLEDAVEKKILTVDVLYNHLKTAWHPKSNPNGIDLFDKVVEAAYRESRPEEGSPCSNYDDRFFMKLRVNTIRALVPYVAKRFIDNLAEIFNGDFNDSLLKDKHVREERMPENEHGWLLDVYKKVARQHVFSYEEVEELELQGYRVIKGLLDIYSPLLDMSYDSFTRLEKDDDHPDFLIETRLLHKLSSKHRDAYKSAIRELIKQNTSAEQLVVYEFYYRVRLLQDYISGMTDNYAYDEYRKLTVSG